MAPYLDPSCGEPATGQTNPDGNNAMDYENPSNTPVAPIAICGMALRLSGGISNPSEFWDFLINRKDARSLIPKSRFDAEALYSASGKKGHLTTRHGYFLDESIDLGALDTTFFNISKSELERVDPQQRLLLEIARECLEDAGETGYRGTSVGTYVGSFGQDWLLEMNRDTLNRGIYKVTGQDDFALSNRIAFEYDLKGPSMTVRTACSASLLALHEACLAIRAGECKAALVGGSSLIMGPDLFVDMCDQGVLSPDGSCRAFDAGANGFARGEAVNMIYIKRLDDALWDGNPIRAIIRGSSSNADGKSSGLTMPSTESHEAMIRRAYEVSGISNFSATPFVECHGTGTQAGDPVETKAVARVFGDKGVYIGSVKPNVGHTEGASGITSLIKCVLALENRTIPPNIKFNKPNPNIPFKEGKLTVPVDAMEWPSDRSERVSVNSFGIGGANCHVVLESRRSVLGDSRSEKKTTRPRNQPHLLVYSANTLSSLQRQALKYQNYFQLNPLSASDLSYTLGSRREHLLHRAFSVVGDEMVPNNSPYLQISASSPRLAMIFTGQGAQWPQMGVELLKSDPVFSASIKSMDQVLQSLPEAPSWSIEDELMKGPDSSNLDQAYISQPLCVALQVALVDVLSSIGVEPYGAVGHSSGEIAAAYASKRLSAREAIIAAYYRGLISGKVTRPGSMAAIGMNRAETCRYLIPGVVIACENSPSNVTISGDKESVEVVVESIKNAKPEVLARLLKVDKAYHSHHMKQVGEEYQSLVSSVAKGAPGLPSSAPLLFSSVTGKMMDYNTALDANYWRSNLESPVLFNTAVANFVSYYKSESPSTNLVFLEVGPHSALAGPLRQILKSMSFDCEYASCLTRGINSSEAFLSAVGNLWQRNVPIAFDALTNRSGTAKVLTDLPSYPWNHDHSYKIVSRLVQDWKFHKFSKHELLGSRVFECTESEPVWRNILKLEQSAWLQDHNIKGDVIFPCASYVGMVGEAMRQISLGSLNEADFVGFGMKNVVIHTAMVLAEKKPTEVVTSLKRCRWSDSIESHWWEFSVSSHNSMSWIKHCTGFVCARGSKPLGQLTLSASNDALPRKVDSRKFYQSCRSVGANYGPHFQGLKNLSCSTMEHVARGTAGLSITDEVEYSVHPTQIDLFLQILLIATTKGVGHGIETMMVPTAIKALEARKSVDEMQAIVNILSDPTTASSFGNGQAINSVGDIVFQAEGIEFNALEPEEDENSTDPHAGAQVYWQLDPELTKLSDLMNSVDPGNQLELMQELNLLCVQECLVHLEGIETNAPHLQQFLSWMKKQPAPTTKQTILELFNEIRGRTFHPLLTLMLRVLRNIVPIFQGDAAPLEILMADGGLTDLYNITLTNRMGFFRSLGHSNPSLRVLEIGAGTGGTTAVVLKGLQAPNKQAMYQNYTYTDISAGFFDAGKDRFKEYPNMTFKTLDISRDPLEQGFEAESYDLIIGANVLHATMNLTNTLSNVRKLLSPEGTLYMEELCGDFKAINFVTGILPGWWLGKNDGRPDAPVVDPERWGFHLKEAGFYGVDDVAVDGSSLTRFTAFITAKPIAGTQSVTEAAIVLHDQLSKDLANNISSQLLEHGIVAHLHDLAQPLQTIEQEVIAVVDLHAPFFEAVNPDNYSAFQSLLSNLADSNKGMLWLTRASQMNCSDPRWAQTIGACRSIRNELSIDIATCELENTGDKAMKCVSEVFKKFQKRSSSGSMKPDMEYTIADGQAHISRLYPVVINYELAKSQAQDSNSSCVLEIETFGRINSLRWIPKPPSAVVGDQVEVEIKVAGVNFRDVLCAMGIIKIRNTDLGFEASGVVSNVGPEVKELKKGDRVMAMAPGCYTTRLVSTEPQCAKIPDSLSFEAAATMPSVFTTVIHGLLDKARLEKGQSVLIHSACGGVGLAAIQICKMVGAKIYCTVGTDEKVQYLQDKCQIPLEQIFNSRDTSFLSDILRATDGEGVDVVLNSLSGELLHASWECVAPFGCMVEIGKRDLVGHGKLDLGPFLVNRAYFGLDMSQLLVRKPWKYNKLMKTLIQYYNEGFVQPLNERHLFTPDKIQDCFRFMQKGQHIGKLLVPMNSPDISEAPTPQRLPSFNPESSYLLVGGLGGLGRVVSNWMVENRAKSLVFLSRSAGESPSDESFFEELRSQGCIVTAIKGSITVLEDVARAVSSAPTPIKGIMNMSMELRDQSFLTMPLEDWNAVAKPKVLGTWNLHNVCQKQGIELDFFVLFSSISGLTGQKGQASYAGANTFLDAFVQYRNSLGLKASVIDICMIKDHGYASENQLTSEHLSQAGVYSVKTKHLLDVVGAATLPRARENYEATFYEPSQWAIGIRSTLSFSDPSSHTPWKKDRRLALYHNMHGGAGELSDSLDLKTDESGDLLAFIRSAMAEPLLLNGADVSGYIARHIGIKLQALLLRPVQDGSQIDVTRTLQESGLDSLLAIEARAWWKKVFRFDISVLEMLGMGSLQALGDRAVAGLKDVVDASVKAEGSQ